MKSLIKDRAHWLGVWIRFRSGNQTSLHEIYEEFIDPLFAYGSKITRHSGLIKDCIQDIFVDLQRLQPNLHNPEYIEFYLFKSLKNAIFHKTQEDKKLNNLPIDEMVLFDLQFNVEQDILTWNLIIFAPKN